MPQFGVLTIKNPGPKTEVVLGGCGGWRDADYDTFTKAMKLAEEARAQGHLAQVVVVFDGDEGEGIPQLEIGYELEDARDNNCMTEEEEEKYDAEN